MNYEQAVEYIHSLLRFGVSPGLERIEALCELLDNPQDKLSFIHVCGTNGKGTTCSMLSNVLREAGYKTGLFTSPFVVDFCERMQVNNRFIEHDELAEIVEQVKAANEKLSERGIYPTEFETITAAGLLWFAQTECDIVVLECGMGGEHDSTNIIPRPLLAVFTSISLDHTAVLGETVAEIAKEKSGIMKDGCLAVGYPSKDLGLGFMPQNEDAAKVLERAAEEKGSMLIFANDTQAKLLGTDITGSDFYAFGLNLHVPFLGEHQLANTLTAVCALRALQNYGLDITDENIVDGIAQSRMPARMEIMSNQPLIILDGGHNAGCAQAVHDALTKYLPDNSIVALCALMADKECDVTLSKVLPLCRAAVFTAPDNPRASEPQALKQAGEKYCAETYAVNSSTAALEFAKSLLKDGEVLLIFGSFYLAGEIRDSLLEG